MMSGKRCCEVGELEQWQSTTETGESEREL